MEICPVCGAQALMIEAGCHTCYACGYSKCEKWDTEQTTGFSLDLGGEDAKVHPRDGDEEGG